MKSISLKEHLNNIRPALHKKLIASGHMARMNKIRWAGHKKPTKVEPYKKLDENTNDKK